MYLALHGSAPSSHFGSTYIEFQYMMWSQQVKFGLSHFLYFIGE